MNTQNFIPPDRISQVRALGEGVQAMAGLTPKQQELAKEWARQFQVWTRAALEQMGTARNRDLGHVPAAIGMARAAVEYLAALDRTDLDRPETIRPLRQHMEQ